VVGQELEGCARLAALICSRGDLLNVGDGFFVLQKAARVLGSLVVMQTRGGFRQ
jgi:hypothetical protein